MNRNTMTANALKEEINKSIEEKNKIIDELKENNNQFLAWANEAIKLKTGAVTNLTILLNAKQKGIDLQAEGKEIYEKFFKKSDYIKTLEGLKQNNE